MLTSRSRGEPHPLGPGSEGQEVRAPFPQVLSAGLQTPTPALPYQLAARLQLCHCPGRVLSEAPSSFAPSSPSPQLLRTTLLNSGPKLDVLTLAFSRQVTPPSSASVSPTGKWRQGPPSHPASGSEADQSPGKGLTPQPLHALCPVPQPDPSARILRSLRTAPPLPDLGPRSSPRSPGGYPAGQHCPCTSRG